MVSGCKTKTVCGFILLSHLKAFHTQMPGTCKCEFSRTLHHSNCSTRCSAASAVLTPWFAHRFVPKPAVLPKDDTEQSVRQMQSLSLQPQQDTTAWDSGPGPHTSATSQANSQHDSNQYSAYDPQRDSTAQPMSVWQNQGYSYDDPYSYSGYGGYYGQEAHAEETYEPEVGDDWGQVGFVANNQGNAV